MDKANTPAKPIPTNLNRWGYAAFTLAGILFSFWSSDPTQGPMFMALALIFDPYEQTVPWNERPRWVKVMLYAHLGVAAALLGYVIGS
jgi:hypothetical protein